MRMKLSLLLASVLMAAPGLAVAQAPPTPTTPPAQTAPPPLQRPTDCAPMQAPNSGAATPDGQTTGQRSEPLGDRLARSNGVLCPPAGVDPEMRAPTPDGGNTPVIPPPGSPGGDPTIRPK